MIGAKKIHISSALSDVRGVGAKTAALFEKRGLYTVEDLLRYYPRAYDYYADPILVSDAVPGQMTVLTLVIIGSGTSFHAQGKSVSYYKAGDAGGQIRLTWFNQPYLKKTLQAGSIHVFRGILKQNKNGGLFMEQPQIFLPEEYEKIRGSRQPRYSLPMGLKNNQVIRTLKAIFEQLDFENAAPEDFGGEYLNENIRSALGLIPEGEAVRAIHFPMNEEEQGKARRRLSFDEFFYFLLAIYSQREHEEQRCNPRPMIETADPARLIEQLPYELTASQKKAWKEIKSDLCSTHVMNRLLQGDVGSGKTILAFLSLLLTASNGRQGALMAPTEVLAEQHMRDLEEMVRKYHLPLHPVLLTGSVKGNTRRSALEEISSGEANIIIGTHALIQDKVQYHDLGLVITDEQHRFGVRQRETFAGKGTEVPILVMSATPIPRTLAIILYGDLQVSLLTDMPADRLPVKNTVLDEEWREKAYHFVEKQIGAGHQAYIICPAVEAGELENVANVADYSETLRTKMPESIVIESLNGRMKPADKEAVMNRYADHEIDILVSTTVIEVGINVPNATVMMIENAERFGLAQLHQLRGRVGRGNAQSYCIFLYSRMLQEKPKRLEILEHSTDGFYIAEQDLKMRGPGDLFGIRQSGELGFVLADIYNDADLLRGASSLVNDIIRDDPELAAEEHAAIKGRLSHETAKSVDFRTI